MQRIVGVTRGSCHSFTGVAMWLQRSSASKDPRRGMDAHPYHIVDFSSKIGHLLNLLATPVTLCQGWQSGSKLIPALYEKAQAPEKKYLQRQSSSNIRRNWHSPFGRAERLHIHNCRPGACAFSQSAGINIEESTSINKSDSRHLQAAQAPSP